RSPVIGPGALRCDRLERIPILAVLEAGWPGRTEEPLALAADAERLALRDRLHPSDQRVALDRRRLGEQDLEGALIGVLGVIRADRVAPCGAPKHPVVAL